jgi:hypothetical protein
MIYVLAAVVVALGTMVLVPALTLLFVFNRALPFAVLWRWFVMPLGVPGLSYVHAFGILLVFSLLKNVSQTIPGKTKEQTTTDLISSAIQPWLLLLCGWLMKGWM